MKSDQPLMQFYPNQLVNFPFLLFLFLSLNFSFLFVIHNEKEMLNNENCELNIYVYSFIYLKSYYYASVDYNSKN